MKFPEIRELFKEIKIITSFSHANINLPIDEINSNDYLLNLKSELNLNDNEILNILYDNSIPSYDNPKGHRIQYGPVNPVVMEEFVPYSFQKNMNYNEKDIIKNNINVLHSIPDENHKYFISRINKINSIYIDIINSKDTVLNKILKIRKYFFSLIDIKPIAEKPFSEKPTKLLSKTLKILYEKGYPFWKMKLPEKYIKYKSKTFFVEGINEGGLRVPVKFDRNNFVFDYNTDTVVSIKESDIFNAIKNRKVIPTLPLIITALMVAPQIKHIGGADWPIYVYEISESIRKWLDMDIDVRDYFSTTGGNFYPYVCKKSVSYFGFPIIYSTFGKEKLKQYLNTNDKITVELQRKVFI